MDKSKMPVFVKIDEYKGVIETMDLIKAKIQQAKDTLVKINKLKNEEDAELELWHAGIEEVERKVDFCDKTLFEPVNL